MAVAAESEIAKVDEAGKHPELYIVKNPAAKEEGAETEYKNLADLLRNIIQRASASLKRIITSEGLTEDKIAEGLKDGTFMQMTRAEVMKILVESESGIGLTGGGDCAGIADFLSALALNLNPDLVMLGIKNAGTGLVVPPSEFKDQLVIIDPLLAKDFEGQSSTPIGSARVNALEEKYEGNTMINIGPYMFVYGTGGDDHLGMLATMAKKFPDKIIVGTFKSIDGDGCIGDQPAQMLGFRTAMEDYQKAFWGIAQNAESHRSVNVVELFGRKSGKLAFEATRKDPKNLEELDKEGQRKIEELGENIMILVPEKPTSLRSIGEEAADKKTKRGSCTIAVAEGFMPPELAEAMRKLERNESLRKQWKERSLNPLEIYKLVEPESDLAKILKDPSLAVLFGKTIWDKELDAFGNGAKLAGIRHFIIAAVKEFGKIKTANECMENYEARGATPGSVDSVMGEKLGRVAAQEVINKGITGGRAVVYLEGMDPLKEDPIVMPLERISNKNTLNLYSDETLKKGGVFWKE